MEGADMKSSNALIPAPKLDKQGMYDIFNGIRFFFCQPIDDNYFTVVKP